VFRSCMGGAGQGLRLVFGELMQEEMRQGIFP